MRTPPLDPALLERATQVWIRAHRWALARTKRTGSKKPYRGPTVDQVLADAGVTFEADRALYLAYERAARRRMYRAVLPEFSPSGRQRRKSYTITSRRVG